MNRFLALSLLAALSAGAMAENYVGVVYGTPSGFVTVGLNGAGDNGLMAGSGGNDQNFQEHAFYMTHQGIRSMHPAGWTDSYILDSWGGTYHVGGGSPPGGFEHALLWIGGSGVPVDLHPANAPQASSRAEGGFGQIQVGWFDGPLNGPVYSTACMWSRTAASFQMLSAPNHVQTHAYATDGIVQVGDGRINTTLERHALRWRGPGSNPVDMHPAGAENSIAKAVDGAQIGGWARFNGNPVAALWTMTSTQTVFTNLQPAPFQSSEIEAIRNGVQVGSGYAHNSTHSQAILWHGSAATWTNLHAKLPLMFQTWNSFARDIDNQGNVVGHVVRPFSTESRPVIWRRVN